MDVATTDAIAACFAAGRVTSATAMVFMADSERAAARARAIGLPVGLHLNLSEPFSGAAVPEPVLRRQRRLAVAFGDRRRRLRRWLPSPTLRSAIERCVVDQLAEFRRLYGREPTHVDGHKHVHISPTVARTPALTGFKLRRALTDTPGRAFIESARRGRHRRTLQRSSVTDGCLSMWSMRDELLAGREPQALRLAPGQVVEVMAHPGLPEEWPLLMSDAWAGALAGVRLGTYEDVG